MVPGRTHTTTMTEQIDDLVSHAGAVVHDLRAILTNAETTLAEEEQTMPLGQPAGWPRPRQ